MDREINQVQEQLKSIRSINKMQDKEINGSVENAEIKHRLFEYQKEIKGFKDKLKEGEKKGRKREMEFKKQQAYLVAL